MVSSGSARGTSTQPPIATSSRPTRARGWIRPLLKDLKFHEYFITNSAQPYIEYQLVAIPRVDDHCGSEERPLHHGPERSLPTAARWAIWVALRPPLWVARECRRVTARTTTTSFPRFEANYRINNNWSAYGQYGRGSEIPPSSIFDVTGAQVAVTPKPTVATTYQGGSVVKINRLEL